MTRRNKILIIVLLGLIVLALLLLWLWRGSGPAPTAPAVIVPKTEQPEAPTAPPEETPPAAEPAATNTETGLIALSKTFAERYGSFSNEANFANLVDVLPLMDDALAAKTRTYIETTEPSPTYFGVTTKVLRVNVDALDEAAGSAAVTVATQRLKAEGSAANVTVTYEILALGFVKINSTWKVASANWQ